MLVAFLQLHRRTLLAVLPATALAGCAAGAGAPAPVPVPATASSQAVPTVEMVPGELHDGQAAALVVRSPGADSIAFESENGIDRSSAPRRSGSRFRRRP
jgi:hypothetical protein